MLRRVALIKIDVSEEHIASIIRVTGIGEIGTMLAITGKRSMLRRNTVLCICSIAFLRSVLRFQVTANFADSCHLVDEGDKFLRNVGSYKSGTAPLPRRRNSSSKMQVE
jgi:hypothetical protein